MTDYTLYGSQASLFTGKARGFLRWKGARFTEQKSIVTVLVMPTCSSRGRGAQFARPSDPSTQSRLSSSRS